ncbi:MAG: extracellular solute-binding protein [Cyanobacteria bacterium P01_E01_bin.6]
MNSPYRQTNAPNSSHHLPCLMGRRSLLKGLGAIALAQLAAGCGGSRTPDITIQFLKNSIPTALLREFQKANPTNVVQFQSVETLSSVYDALTATDATIDSSAMATVLGDYWLTPAIRQNLIAPIDPKELDGWSRIPTVWKELVTRNAKGMPASNGKVWGAPYRWGSLAIIYQIEAFETLGWVPTDWTDLWRPELKQHISLPDSPRTVIGLALKQLGESFNATTLDNQSLSKSSVLNRALQDLQAQVKLYSSSAYLQPLTLGDTWLAVGWSTDVLPLLRRDRRFAAVIPASGTALTADVWVRPTTPTPTPDDESEEVTSTSSSAPVLDDVTRVQTSIFQNWIKFCWQPNVAQRISLQGFAASPVLVDGDRARLPDSLRTDALLLPDPSILDQSDFILPLPDDVLAEYKNLWTAMRLGNENESDP